MIKLEFYLKQLKQFYILLILFDRHKMLHDAKKDYRARDG